MREKRERKWTLNEAYLYHGTLSDADYRHMKEVLEQDILTLEMKRSEAQQEEIEIEELLDFSENLLLNAGCRMEPKRISAKTTVAAGSIP